MNTFVNNVTIHFKSIWPTSCLMISLMYSCTASTAAVTNTIPNELKDSATVWGAEKDDFCAGFRIWRGDGEKSPATTVTVFVLTSKTNALWNYVEAPENRFAKVELRDTNGVIIAPLQLTKLDADLPLTIVEEDLPTTPRVIHLRRAWLILPPGTPEPLKEFHIENVYHIQKEGDYTLTICVAIYQFAPDRKSLLRRDLPCVTAKVHLVPQQ